ncbi:MFS transporter [Halomonas heilongjiangensis]|uniref:MFS transporter n=1 Tax=Halomonas heilongjiangensis TaxID=1387883 RepID=A0A2N7TFN2_9GAMM|nr:MFS transporter [Halomonas heilongjiangensis]PMR66997.1 MFS transporter [Halomonas heilongjiangensis]PXX88087.1 MFS transporter [Halomonas heilongjiangensis]
MSQSETTPRVTTPSGSAWSPLKISLFRTLWIATLVSNIGTWMHDIGAGWLMTSLSDSSVMVALVQTATTLPVFLLALPAGALSDILDRRRYLIAIQSFMAIVAVLLTLVVVTGTITPWTLLILTFVMGVGSAMMRPTWAAIVPELVPRRELQAAIALNSMGINVARAIGPALAGVIVMFAGTGAVFVLNAFSFFGVILVLMRWRREVTESPLPAERLVGAMRAGLRFARFSPELQAASIRGLGFFLFASASWALLPLVARNLTNGGPQAFGILVAAVGVGAVLGALVLPTLKERLSRGHLVALSTLLYAACLVGITVIDRLWPLALVMGVSGVAWLVVLSSLQVAAQMALPNWVRSRGLAIFMSAFMGSMALGSLLWGKLADLYSIEHSLLIAAIGAALSVPLTWRWRVDGVEALDFTPSMHWPLPPAHDVLHLDRGPVMTTIEYWVRPEAVSAFLGGMKRLEQYRRQHGAFSWSLFEHAEVSHLFIETFNDESWVGHLRQHERVTEEVRKLQAEIRTYLAEDTNPKVAHYLTPKRGASHRKDNG